MNSENLHDALNLLDEDLIAPTAHLRQRRVRWHHLGALAACLAVVCAVGVFAFAQKSGSPEAAPEGALVDESTDELTTQPAQDDAEALQPNKRNELVPGVDMVDANDHLVLMETVLVEVIGLGEGQFTAKVLEADRFYAQGDTVTFRLTELTRLIEGKNAYPLPEGEQSIPVGAVLKVDYSFSENRAVIAECITFGER